MTRLRPCPAALMAQRYARRGKPPFPVQPRGKSPLTPNGLLDATRDLSTIAGWWERWPDANVAIRTGAPSGIVVLDVDPPAGADTLRELERTYGALPITTSVKTPRGGSHIYFQHPGREVRNSAGQVGPGLDVRGDGGYVLAPPSIGENGRPYEWDEEAKPAPMPDWLLALAAPSDAARKLAAPVSDWLRIAAGLGEGERNSGLARLVGHLLHKNVDVLLVLELAQLVNTRNRPPLDAREVERIVDSIAGTERRNRTRRAA